MFCIEIFRILNIKYPILVSILLNIKHTFYSIVISVYSRHINKNWIDLLGMCQWLSLWNLYTFNLLILCIFYLSFSLPELCLCSLTQDLVLKSSLYHGPQWSLPLDIDTLVQFPPVGWVVGLICVVNSIQQKWSYATFKTRAFVVSMFFFTHNLQHWAAIQRGSHGEEQKSLANSHQENKLGNNNANSLVSELGNFFSIFNRSNNLITNLWKILNLYCKWSSP